MLYAPPSHEHHEKCNTAITPDITVHATGWRPTCRPALLGRVLLLAMPHMFLVCGAAASPITPQGNNTSLLRRVGTLPGSVAPVKIWAPIIAIGLLIALTAVGLCFRRTIADWMGRCRSRATTGTRNVQGTRELTAEQLAGTINTSNTRAPPLATANRTARRTRRPRRTPSQISTISLPAYAKEPGEQELVIFRGPEDMEDAGMPTALVMPSLSEDGESVSMHSRDNSEASRYTPMPTSPNDMPLLQHDESADPSVQSSEQHGHNLPRRSVETLSSSEEASSLMRVTSNTPDPRGEAPAYFEAVDITPEDNSDSPQTSALPSSPESPVPREQVPQRRSGFRTLLNSLPNRLSMASNAQTHSRGNSTFSMVSSDHSHGRETSQSRASHRPTQSGSGSLLSLSPFRTVSRQRSQNNLNSPSLISVNSISAPLTHTLTRTEFTYPKAGPTPEQLKLISSRDSFARFGMPYGPDAIAYAASASRHDLDVPPPDFDLQPPLTDTQGVPGSAGPSRLRTTSNAADLQWGAEAEEAEADLSSSANAQTALPDSGTSAGAAPSQGRADEPSPTATSEVVPPVSGSPSSKDKGKAKEVSSSHPDVDGMNSSSISSTDSAAVAVGPSSSSHSGTDDPTITSIAATSAGAPASTPHTSADTLLNPKLSSPSPAPATPPTLGTPSLGVPPSSFRAPSVLESRSVSRASSIQSFATAAESMGPPSSDDDDDDREEPTTPTLGGRHVLEPTDETIKATPTGKTH
ncbi:hypothetical protein Hypma_009504 [Hypsizygus marmoreus]|uniref:Proteophosphoglycan ppg4 n=1 Tax=Hypsizygus marmoreus TaxID=39966 RepID=A0A369JP23_HYPMA|nr:hypothetical protein Hypma_009504 [Hypsizygus marmoreus]